MKLFDERPFEKMNYPLNSIDVEGVLFVYLYMQITIEPMLMELISMVMMMIMVLVMNHEMTFSSLKFLFE